MISLSWAAGRKFDVSLEERVSLKDGRSAMTVAGPTAVAVPQSHFGVTLTL
jgi:hypothetical protein